MLGSGAVAFSPWAANAALIAFLANTLGVPKRQVAIVRGERSRQKTVALYGVSADRVRTLVGG